MKKEFKKYIPWIVLLVIILSLSLWYVLSKRVTQEQIDQYGLKIEEAQQYTEARQYSVAMDKYYEAVDIVPKKVEAYEGLIDILILKNRIDDAVDVVEKSAKPLNNQDKSILYEKVGDGFMQIGKYQEAYDMYDMGLVLGVKNMSLELSLGKVFLKLGYIDQAKDQFEKGGYEGDEKAESILLLSYIYALEDQTRAKKTFETVDPSESMTAYYEELQSVFDSLNEDSKFNATKLSRIYVNNGYPYLAIKLLEPIKEDISEYLEGMYFLGRAYFEFGNYEKAVETLDGALTLGGMETDILWTKGRAYMLMNDLDNMERSYDSAIGYAGSNLNEDLANEYIDILLSNKQGLKASELIKNLLQLLPDEPFLNILAVKIYDSLSEDVKVDFYLNKLSTLTLTDSQKKEYLRWKIGSMIDGEESIDNYLVELENLDKFNPYYQYFLAKSQIKEEENELAIQSLERAIEYDLSYRITQEASKLLSSLR